MDKISTAERERLTALRDKCLMDRERILFPGTMHPKWCALTEQIAYLNNLLGARQ